MTINVKKSHFLSFKSKGTQFNFTIMNKRLQEINESSWVLQFQKIDMEQSVMLRT
mgnify:CR=1 FL=1